MELESLMVTIPLNYIHFEMWQMSLKNSQSQKLVLLLFQMLPSQFGWLNHGETGASGEHRGVMCCLVSSTLPSLRDWITSSQRKVGRKRRVPLHNAKAVKGATVFICNCFYFTALKYRSRHFTQGTIEMLKVKESNFKNYKNSSNF